MKVRSFLGLSFFGITTVLFKRKKPLIGSLIITDKCNLSCKHCAVSSAQGTVYSYTKIRADMQALFALGVRVLLFYGGEPLLWKDSGKTLRDLVVEAKQMGFLFVNVVTNGTFALELPEADLILVSIDGSRETHNAIRGNSYDLILEHIRQSASNNICLYMAVNRLNKDEIEQVCQTATRLKPVKAVSFNIHTPYTGTEHLALNREERQTCCKQIAALIDRGYPILNLKSALPYIAENKFPTPCHQCVIMEDRKMWTCGRCIDIEGLCKQCGYFFAAEYALVFSGNLKVIVDALKTYGKYL